MSPSLGYDRAQLVICISNPMHYAYTKQLCTNGNMACFYIYAFVSDHFLCLSVNFLSNIQSYRHVFYSQTVVP